jgi:hypothetical protein
MSDKACTECPQLRSEVARLTRAYDLAQQRLLAWRASVSAAATLIGRELEEPQMAMRRLVQVVQARLNSAIDADSGRR